MTSRPLAPPTIIRAGAVFDGVSAQLRAATEILVIDGRIAEIADRVSRPDGAEFIELTEHTVSPGFIDCHVHSEVTPDRLLGTFFHESSAMKSLFAVPGLRDMLDCGFTTVRDAAGLDDAYGTVDLKRAIERGLIPGPRMLVCPHMLSGTGGHGEAPALDPCHHQHWMGIVDGPDAIRKRVRQEIFAGADWIKVSLSGFLGLRGGDGPEQMSWTQAEMDACVEAARDFGVDTCVHALGDESVRRAVQSGARSIEHASLASVQTLEKIAAAGTYVVPTMHMINLFLTGEVVDVATTPAPSAVAERPPVGLFVFDDELAAAQRRIADSNVMIAFGSDSGGFPHADAWKEFGAMVSAGISPLRALRAATSVAAELLRRPDLGRLSVGAVADIIAMRGDPLTDIEATGRVDFVMKEGRIRRGATSPLA